MRASVTDGKDHAAHHIQDVAHYFLGNEASAVDSQERTGIPCTTLPAARHFALSAVGDGLSSRLVLDLAQATLGGGKTAPAAVPRVILRKWGRSDAGISARSQGTACPGPTGGQDFLGVDLAEATAASSRPEVSWLDLGEACDQRLTELESAAVCCREVGCPLAGQDGLVWCLPLVKAESWRSAYSLGRLAAALNPVQVKILLCEDEVVPDGQWVRSAGTGASVTADLKCTGSYEVLQGVCRSVHAAAGLPDSTEVLVVPAPARTTSRTSILQGVVHGLIQGARC